MKQFGLVGLAALMAFVAASPATAATVVAPSGLDAVEGNSGSRNVFGFINVARQQQVFNSSQFANGPITLTGIAFRANGATFGNGPFDSPGSAFTRTTQGLQIGLSTTTASADALSTTFAANVGADLVNVLSGDITYSSQALSSNGLTRDFDVVFTFANAFNYDPARGNLLLDVLTTGGSNRAGTTLDGQNLAGDGTSSVFRSNGTTGTGTASTFGYVTQFQIAAVPEPATWAMMLIGFGAIGGAARYRRRKTNLAYA
jgi:hypothetical protein